MKRLIKLFFWLTTPIQKILQKLSRQETKITESQVKSIVSLIKEGDIVLSFEYGRLTSILIKGFYNHAAIVTSKVTIMEAVGDQYINGKNIGGVREIELEEWLYKKDYVAVIRPIYDTDIPNKIAAATSFYFKGKDYDYQFRIDNDSVYCSELVYLCYSTADKDFLNHINDEILPQKYYDLCKDSLTTKMKFQLIKDTRLEKDN